MQSWLEVGVMWLMKVGVAYQATCKQIQCTVGKGNIQEPWYSLNTRSNTFMSSLTYCMFYGTYLVYVCFFISFNPTPYRSPIISHTCHWTPMLWMNKSVTTVPNIQYELKTHESKRKPPLPQHFLSSIHFSYPSSHPPFHSPAFQTRGIFDLQDKGGGLK